MGRTGIERAGWINPGPDGRVYVTSERFASAREAQQKLALPNEPIGYFEIPEDRLPGLSDPQEVVPNHGQPGGGIEHYLQRPINASGLSWRELDL